MQRHTSAERLPSGLGGGGGGLGGGGLDGSSCGPGGVKSIG
jgi:hypothetical protein